MLDLLENKNEIRQDIVSWYESYKVKLKKKIENMYAQYEDLNIY